MINFIKNLLAKEQLQEKQPREDNKIIIEDKIYNISKSERIISLWVWDSLLINRRREVRKVIYKTAKGNWFTVTDGRTGELETERSVKSILKVYNKIDTYEKYFGELEEA